MNATVNAVLFKSKTLANGEHPLMIRICKDNKKKYKSLGISLNAIYWDFEKNKPRKNCPNKEEILNLISERIKEYSKQIIDFKSENKEFTVNNLVEKVNISNIKQTVLELLDSETERLKKEGRLKYASTFKELKTSLLDFKYSIKINDVFCSNL